LQVKKYKTLNLSSVASGAYTLILASCIFLFSSLPAYSQLQITFPQERAVFQRDQLGKSNIPVAGNYTKTANKIEARVVPVRDGQGQGSPWTVIADKPSGGIFNGSIQVSQGWYKLEVRATMDGNIVGTSDISKVGVGEVFIISGQSNAQGVDHITTVPLPPGASDDRVNIVRYNNDEISSLQDPPFPEFAHLDLQDEGHIMGPRGRTAWCWGMLGDSLAKKLNVPVLFINTAWSGTSIQNWLESSKGIPTSSVYSELFRFPDRMPYGNLRLAVQNYARQYGLRAVLWMLGESDTYPVRMGYSDFKSKLEEVIRTLSADAGRELPWMIARTSKITDGSGIQITSQAIIDAENDVIRGLGAFGAYGPETDALQVNRIDGVHFFGVDALKVLASAWNDRLDEPFFKNITPSSPTSLPAVEIACAQDNNSISLNLPGGYQSYRWTIEREDGSTREENTQNLVVSSPGKYSASIKDAFGNTNRTQLISITSGIRPAPPVITPEGNFQICSDSTLTFTASAGQESYQWSSETAEMIQAGTTFRPETSGTFSVRTENLLGCLSEKSAPVSVEIRPTPEPPVLAVDGPFSIKISAIPDHGDSGYQWYRNGQKVEGMEERLGIDQPGIYSARNSETFHLEGSDLTCVSAESNIVEIDDAVVSNQFVVFPNPSESGDIYVASKTPIHDAQIQVYDVKGRLILEKTHINLVPSDNLKLSIPNPGQYMLRINSSVVKRSVHLIVR
jgi:hypothetical protein